MVRGEQPYCIPCYMRNFARDCTACSEKIGPDSKRISHKDNHWHATPKCFKVDLTGLLVAFPLSR